ncbi:MAG: DUF1761 domain-containing protein [Xanthobacteraceae bacterium]|nr:DUF1761 domain-containing protein [Xanthobacteraceae bacterium]
MAFAGMNYMAIVAAAIAGWLIGAALRWPFWRERPNKVLPLVLGFTASLIMAWMLAGVLGHLGPGQVTLRNGVISAAFLWFGFVLTSTVVNNTWAGRTWGQTAIDVGHWLVVLLAMGAVVGGIGLR